MSQDGDGSDTKSKPAGEASDGTTGKPAERDDSKRGGEVQAMADIPPTRKHEIADAPPHRPSVRELMADPILYPDDSPLSDRLRSVDHIVGRVEQIALLAMLLIVVGIGAMQAVATKVFQHSFGWSFDVIRGGTFTIAMVAAAFASQQGSHLSMDLVTRRMSARGRLVMRVALGMVTMFATVLLVRSGFRLYELTKKEGGDHTIPAHLLAAMLLIGGGLIIFHTLLRVVIDADYLRRGKLPPEKAPSAH